MAGIRTRFRDWAAAVWGKDFVFNGLLVLAFLVVIAAGLIRHEMWRDELQAWLIARDSTSVADLFHNLRYEGHPAVWHLSLFVLTRFTQNPGAMQVWQALIATAGAYVIARFSPFPRLQKCLLAFGYFPLYEYGVISRSYGLGSLLFFCSCALFYRGNRNPGWLALVLFLLANTSAYGLILALAFTSMLLFEAVHHQLFLPRGLARKGPVALALGILALAFLAALWQARQPSATGALVAILQPSFHWPHCQRTLLTIWESYVPFPAWFAQDFWNSNCVTASYEEGANHPLMLSLALLLGSLVLVARRPAALWLYVSGTLGVLFFSDQVFTGMLRHHGHLFLVFVASWWLSTSRETVEQGPQPPRQPGRFLRVNWGEMLVTGVLVVQVGTAAFFLEKDWRLPFSTSKAVARFIRREGPPGATIIGYDDCSTSPLAAYLHREIYYPQRRASGTFVIWDRYRHHIASWEDLRREIQTEMRRSDQPVFVVLCFAASALGDFVPPGVTVLKKVEFPYSIAPTEHYTVYLLQPGPRDVHQ